MQNAFPRSNRTFMELKCNGDAEARKRLEF